MGDKIHLTSKDMFDLYIMSTQQGTSERWPALAMSWMESADKNMSTLTARIAELERDAALDAAVDAMSEGRNADQA